MKQEVEEFVQIEFLNTEENEEYIKTIKKVVELCFKTENLTNTNLYLNVVLTNPEEIRKTNKEFRNIDKETDVLSFPMFQKEEITNIIESSKNKKPEIEDVLGHSFERELSYMVVHGFYHVMGYDHIKEEDKVVMRPKEEYILNKLNITR